MSLSFCQDPPWHKRRQWRCQNANNTLHLTLTDPNHTLRLLKTVHQRQAVPSEPKPALDMPATPLAAPGKFDGGIKSVLLIKKNLPAHIEEELVRSAEVQGMKVVRER